MRANVLELYEAEVGQKLVSSPEEFTTDPEEIAFLRNAIPDACQQHRKQPSSLVPWRIGSYILELSPEGKPVVVGEGGTAVVYRGRRDKTGPVVAVKQWKLERLELCPSLRIEREILAYTAISQKEAAKPHFSQLLDYDTAQGYTVYDLLHGQTLRGKLETSRPTVDDCLDIAIELAKGLRELHSLAFTHRDIKPENIFLLDNGTVKIIDLGLVLNHQGDAFTEMEMQPLIGTPGYMSPEQIAAGNGTVGSQSDLFSLGVILYEMLEGVPPFGRSDVAECNRRALQEKPEPLRRRFREAALLNALVMKCLAKRPENRFTIDELVYDLQELKKEKGKPKHTLEPSIPQQFWEWYHRSKSNRRFTHVSIALVLASVILSVVLIANAWSHYQRQYQAMVESAAEALDLGKQQQARTFFDQALASSFADRLQLRVQRLPTFYRFGEYAQLVREIDDLLAQPLTRELRAIVSLHKGDVESWDVSRKEVSDKWIHEAKQWGLPVEYQHYADGILATSSYDAVAHWTAALKENPKYQRARVALAFEHAVTGNLSEARKQAYLLSQFHPGDHHVGILEGLCSVLEDDQAGLERAGLHITATIPDQKQVAKLIELFRLMLKHRAKVNDIDPLNPQIATVLELVLFQAKIDQLKKDVQEPIGIGLPIQQRAIGFFKQLALYDDSFRKTIDRVRGTHEPSDRIKQEALQELDKLHRLLLEVEARSPEGFVRFCHANLQFMRAELFRSLDQPGLESQCHLDVFRLIDETKKAPTVLGKYHVRDKTNWCEYFVRVTQCAKQVAQSHIDIVSGLGMNYSSPCVAMLSNAHVLKQIQSGLNSVTDIQSKSHNTVCSLIAKVAADPDRSTLIRIEDMELLSGSSARSLLYDWLAKEPQTVHPYYILAKLEKDNGNLQVSIHYAKQYLTLLKKKFLKSPFERQMIKEIPPWIEQQDFIERFKTQAALEKVARTIGNLLQLGKWLRR